MAEQYNTALIAGFLVMLIGGWILLNVLLDLGGKWIRQLIGEGYHWLRIHNQMEPSKSRQIKQ